MAKKRESLFMKTLRHVLLSGGKGVSESINVFKAKESNTPRQINKNQEIQKVHSTPPVQGKIRNQPIFKDFQVEKKVSGDFSNFADGLNNNSKIILIFGKRGSGKSALGLKIMENIKAQTEKNCYTLGINESFLPKWIESI